MTRHRYALIFSLVSMLLTSWQLFSKGESGVAKVVKVRGQASVLKDGQVRPLKKNQWLPKGAVVVTKKRSFVSLLFTDKSKVNIGPNSEMTIETFGGDDPGLLNVVKGKIRSQVSKNYLSRDKSKMYVKSPNAVMGIRGTDFAFSYNPQTQATSAVLFEGEVAFSKVNGATDVPLNQLEGLIRENGVNIRPGEFSVVNEQMVKATIPAVMNIKQKAALQQNTGFENKSPNKEEKSEESAKRSVVPAGLRSTVVASPEEGLDQALPEQVREEVSIAPQPSASGFVTQEGQVKPINGSFVDLETGLIVPPSKDSVYDPTTNSYIDNVSDQVIGGEDGFELPETMRPKEDKTEGLSPRSDAEQGAREKQPQTIDPTKPLETPLNEQEVEGSEPGGAFLGDSSSSGNNNNVDAGNTAPAIGQTNPIDPNNTVIPDQPTTIEPAEQFGNPNSPNNLAPRLPPPRHRKSKIGINVHVN